MIRKAGFDPRGCRALVYSMGREGQDLARWLIANGARVTMSDTRTEPALRAAGASAPGGVERVVAGQPLLDPGGFDLVCVSQSILRHDPALARARDLGIPVISQLQLFLRLCPGAVTGITGSSGKSTTTALVGAMAAAAATDHIVGGNIGAPLLGRLPEIRPTTRVILEISHTQLQYTDIGPHIAAVTNVTHNHLDQFDWDSYVGLKRHILEDQGPGDIAILNADDAVSMDQIRPAVRGALRLASSAGDHGDDGAWCDGGIVRVRDGGVVQSLLATSSLRLRGAHNVANVVMAVALAYASGIPVPAIAAAAEHFPGVPHRLEVVGRASGALWVNDSIATSPERTIAGLRAFDEPVVLLLGGRDKNLSLESLRALVAQRCRAVVCFGESAALFAAATGGVCPTTVTATMTDAIAAAAGLAMPGDVVLLSPAGTSFDAYPNFEARGESFRSTVRQLQGFEEVAA
jgi:UDP-N-acetylmuramoylalanine--D-glutamate ligase